MSKTLVNGFFPGKNFGDDLFLHVAKEFLGEFSVRNEEKNKRNFLSWINELIKVNDYVWLGGTFIDNDSSLKTILSMLFEFSIVKFFGGKLTFVSVGFSRDVPFWKRLAQYYIIKIANSVSVRDNDSLSFCGKDEKKIKKSEDLVIKYESTIIKSFFAEMIPDEIGGNVLVSLDKKSSLDVIYANIDLFEVYFDFSFFVQISSPYVSQRQSIISKEAIDILGVSSSVEYDYGDARNVMNNIATSSVIITDRLHVAICAALLNRKVFVVGVTEKLKSISLLLSEECMSRIYLLK